jgi:hypothetical protein
MRSLRGVVKKGWRPDDPELAGLGGSPGPAAGIELAVGFGEMWGSVWPGRWKSGHERSKVIAFVDASPRVFMFGKRPDGVLLLE